MKKILALLTIVLIFLTFMSLRGPERGDGPVSEPMAGKDKTVGGPFTLTDQNGKTVSDADYRGKLMLVFFGFTHCPDICPISTASMSKAMEMLGAQGDQVAPIFITVDPRRDTPAVMKDYLANFDKRMIGLTGSPEQIKAAVDGYKAYAEEGDHEAASEEEDPDQIDAETGEPPHKHAHGHDEHEAHSQTGQDYSIDHSGFIYLMGKDGSFIVTFPYDAAPDDIVGTVRANL